MVIAWVKWISEWESFDDRLRFSVVIICWLFIDCLILLRFDISNPRTGKRSNRPLIAFPEIVPRLIAIRLTFFGGFFLTKLFGIFFFHCVYYLAADFLPGFPGIHSPNLWPSESLFSPFYLVDFGRYIHVGVGDSPMASRRQRESNHSRSMDGVGTLAVAIVRFGGHAPIGSC